MKELTVVLGAHVVNDVVVAGRIHVQISRANRENRCGPMLSKKCICAYGPLEAYCANARIGPQCERADPCRRGRIGQQ